MAGWELQLHVERSEENDRQIHSTLTAQHRTGAIAGYRVDEGTITAHAGSLDNALTLAGHLEHELRHCLREPHRAETAPLLALTANQQCWGRFTVDQDQTGKYYSETIQGIPPLSEDMTHLRVAALGIDRRAVHLTRAKAVTRATATLHAEFGETFCGPANMLATLRARAAQPADQYVTQPAQRAGDVGPMISEETAQWWADLAARHHITTPTAKTPAARVLELAHLAVGR